MADMRSEATAIQAYNVDYGRPPIDHNEWNEVFGRAVSDAVCVRVLTTPIAYIASLPIDVFIEKNMIHSLDTTSNRSTNPPFLYENGFAAYPQYATGYPDITPEHYTLQRGAKGIGYLWALCSYGPSRTRNPVQPSGSPVTPNMYLGFFRIVNSKEVNDWRYLPYDPSNGVVSFGFIMNSNKGFVGNLK